MNDKLGQPFPFDVEHLVWALGSIYPPNEAHLRATHILDDLNRLSLRPQLRGFKPDERDENSWIIYYTFGTSAFDLRKEISASSPDTLQAEGYCLGWGNVHDLSDSCEFGRQLWGNDWIKKKEFRTKFKSIDEHITTVEELLWLRLWKNPLNVRSQVKLGGSLKDVDWCFTSCTQIINLEVKLRPKDWKRVVDGPWYSKFQPSIFEDIAEKFPVKHKDELNLVGITLMAPFGRESAEAAQTFLAAHKTIDGVVYWSFGQKDKMPYEFHFRDSARYARDLFQPQKRQTFALILHQWKQRERRRAKRLGTDVDLSKIDGIKKRVGGIALPEDQQD